MGILLLISVFIKGIASIIEILAQALITRNFGVESYGEYTYYIGLIDIIMWCLFSGIVKINMFYLSNPSNTINKFRKNYYIKYVFPVFAFMLIGSIFTGDYVYTIIICAVLMFFMMSDRSSQYMARGQNIIALTGEYLIGRLFIVTFILVLIAADIKNVRFLVIIYSLQYVFILAFFSFFRKRIKAGTKEVCVSLKKLWNYQQSDIVNTFIVNFPVILQYIFVGAYETGFVGIILIVRKLINFISGPTAKIFLPEFSRLYHKNKINKLAKSYETIMRIQMSFVSVVGLALIGFPILVLKIFSPELITNKNLMVVVAIILVFTTSLGPTTGLLQMMDREKEDNIIRSFTLIIMIVILVVMRKNSYFALYGMCTQIIIENVVKYICICKYLKQMPISILNYLILWIPMLVGIGFIRLFNLNESMIALFIIAILTAIFTLIIQLINKDVRYMVLGILRKKGFI